MADPKSSSSTTPSPPEVIFQQPATNTGNFWSEFKSAIKNITSEGPLKLIETVPCARNSLLTGIASGAGMGVVRGLSAGAFVASNWAVGTFIFISLGSWHICQWNMVGEHRRMQVVVEQLPKRLAKKENTADGLSGTNDGTPVTKS